MSWKDLLQESQDRTQVLPWAGGRKIITKNGSWQIQGDLPQEFGWYTFNIQNRTASVLEKSDEKNSDILIDVQSGYLAGNKFISDFLNYIPKMEEIFNYQTVHLIDEPLDKFARVKVGKIFDNGKLFFIEEDFPLGPESDALDALLDNKDINNVSGITPSLHLAFNFEIFLKEKAEQLRQEREARRLEEERKAKIAESLGDGALRRELAKTDFESAARAALSIGGAEYIDHRKGLTSQEMIVRYRLGGQRLECVCDPQTLAIRDSGICLTAEYDGEFEQGTKGDTWFTLESLPGVVKQAQDEDVLVIYRPG